MMDLNDKFLPRLTRRGKYATKNNGEPYTTYRKYHDAISEDCLHRCVYCDITMPEIGNEGMVLDHFRPQKLYPQYKSEPTNLVLSCPKCNGLKSDHWPAGLENDKTVVNGLGFIDPFDVDRKDYFNITDDGELEPKQAPAQYMEKLLLLNRRARKMVRRRRIVMIKANELFYKIINENANAFMQLENHEISEAECLSIIKKNQKMLTTLKEVADSTSK